MIRDLDGWGQWLPGLRSAEVVAHTNAVVVQLDFLAPRPLSVSVDVTELDDGVRFRMVEGDLVTLEGAVTVSARKGGCTLLWRMSLGFPTSIPGPLLAEIELEILPAWSGALIRAARKESDQSAD